MINNEDTGAHSHISWKSRKFRTFATISICVVGFLCMIMFYAFEDGNVHVEFEHRLCLVDNDCGIVTPGCSACYSNMAAVNKKYSKIYAEQCTAHDLKWRTEADCVHHVSTAIHIGCHFGMCTLRCTDFSC